MTTLVNPFMSYPAAGGGGAFDPFTLTWLHSHWAEGTEFQALGVADGGVADIFPDESGTRDLDHQATGSPFPLYRAAPAAMNGRPAIDLNGAGSGRYINATTITRAQPLSYVMVLAPAGLTTQREQMISSGSNRPTLRAPHGTASGDVSITAGTTITSAGGVLVTGEPHLIVGVFNGSSSVIEVNGTSVATGSTSSSLDGRTVSVGAVSSDASIAFAGIYAGNVLADAGWAAWEADCLAHYGI